MLTRNTESPNLLFFPPSVRDGRPLIFSLLPLPFPLLPVLPDFSADNRELPFSPECVSQKPQRAYGFLVSHSLMPAT